MERNVETANGRARTRPRIVGTVMSAVLAVGLVLGVSLDPVAAEPPTQDGPQAAEYGAAWLAAQLNQQIPMINFGSPDWGVTLDAGLSLAATGTGGEQLDAVWAALVEDRENVVAPSATPGLPGDDSAGRLARTILLAEAIGEDPRAVGSAPGADLVARLVATRRAEGPDAGLFGVQDPTYDGAFRQGYSLAALVAAGVAPDQSAIDWLISQQCGAEADAGAWMPYRADLEVPCAVDQAAFVGPDTNATAAAITGLDAVSQGGEAIEGGLGWLDGVQETDGGWGQMVGFGTDPNSTALVIQALIATDEDASPRFADQSASPLAALLSFQLGCDEFEEDRGAFTYPGSNGAPNGFATAQAVGAAAGAPVLFGPAEIAAGVTPLDCTPPSTTSTTAPPTTGAPTTSVPAATVPTSVTPATVPLPVAGTDASSAGSSGLEVQGATASSASPASPSASGATATSLALTGSPSVPLALVGVVAMLLGAALVTSGRRRRHA